MSQTYRQTVADEVDAVYRSAVRAGMRPESTAGASPEQIAQLMAQQQLSGIPTAVHRIWELIGADPGPFWRDSTTSVDQLGSATKELALRAIGAGDRVFADPEGILVLLEHGGYQFEVIDGADLHLANPPVWLVCEGGEPLDRRWTSVTSWFRAAGRGVVRSKQHFDQHTARGGRDAKGARHFRVT